MKKLLNLCTSHICVYLQVYKNKIENSYNWCNYVLSDKKQNKYILYHVITILYVPNLFLD